MYFWSAIMKVFLMLLFASISPATGQSNPTEHNPEQSKYFPDTSSTGQYVSRTSKSGQYFPGRSNKEQYLPTIFKSELYIPSETNKGDDFHSGSNTGQYNTGQYLSSHLNTGQYLLSPLKNGQYLMSPLDDGQYLSSPFNTGQYPPSGRKSREHDITTVCDKVNCGDGSCNVVIKDEHSPPKAICGTPDGNPSVPIDANSGCRTEGLTTAVLTGDPGGFTPLRPFKCLSCDDCPYGSICINDVCCYGRPNCTKTLGKLFQDSFEFNGRTYALSANPVGEDIHASAICVAQGGYLVEIESSEEDAAIRNFLNSLPNTFSGVLIAGTDRDVEGEFVFQSYTFQNFHFQYSGRRIAYENFRAGEPSDSGTNEDCLELRRSFNFQWNDIRCLGRTLPFLCEFPEVPEINKKMGHPYYHYETLVNTKT